MAASAMQKGRIEIALTQSQVRPPSCRTMLSGSVGVLLSTLEFRFTSPSSNSWVGEPPELTLEQRVAGHCGAVWCPGSYRKDIPVEPGKTGSGRGKL